MDAEKPPLDRHSDAWIRDLRPWIRKRIAVLHEELERPGTETELLRGQIAELRYIIKLTEPEPPEEGTSGSYFPTGKTPT